MGTVLMLVQNAFWTSVALQNEPTIHYYSLKDPEDERGLAWFVLNAFLLVAVALGVTLGLGLAFGFFRAWLLARYPDNPFNGAGNDIVFKLDATNTGSDSGPSQQSTTDS